MPVYKDKSGNEFYVGGGGLNPPSRSAVNSARYPGPDGESVANRYRPYGNQPMQVGHQVAQGYEDIRNSLAIQAAKEQILRKNREAATTGYMGGQAQYQEAGLGALEAQQALAGLLGPEAQQAAIAQLEASPQFQSMVAQGERAILANAAATGGVRGGNTMAALAQFRPQMLSNIIEQQYSRLGGLSGMGAQVGQGLVVSGISREQAAADYQRWLQGMGIDLGIAGIQAEAGGKLGQLSYDLQVKQAEEARRKAEEAKNAMDWGAVGSSALTGAGTGASIGALVAGGPTAGIAALPGALIGAGIGALGGGLLGALPMLTGNGEGF